MRIETTVAQQAVLAATMRRAPRAPAAARPTQADLALGRPAGSGLPSAVAHRLSDLLAADPALAEAVSAQLPAARQASRLDLAGYAGGSHRTHSVDTIG
jgi:hypothetical protein